MKSIALISPLVAMVLFPNSAVAETEENGKRSATVVLASKVRWAPLNPARGNKGPKAAMLWSDRNGLKPSGFLVEFANGFSSPPHIHNVSYRGVVVHGLVHNDDPEAKTMWMPTGSYWTQPAGEVHITAAKGEKVLAYIEIERGPYLVLPKEKAFDKGERPVNVHTSNLVWLGANETSWIDKASSTTKSAQISFLWGSPKAGQLSGFLVKLPAGFSGSIRSDSSVRAVVIKGDVQYHRETGPTELTPGSYFDSKNAFEHRISSKSECLVYLRSTGTFKVLPTRGNSR